MITIWHCDPEASLHAQLAADTDRAWREYDRADDLAHEQLLAREQLGDYGEDIEGDGCPWPEYADRFYEVAEPEMIEGMSDWPVLADSDEEDEDE